MPIIDRADTLASRSASRKILLKRGKVVSHKLRRQVRIVLACFNHPERDRATVPLTQNQFDALVSFSFNVGVGAFSKSTLLKRLNQKDYAGAKQEFRRWVYAGGRRLQGNEKFSLS